MEYDNVTCCRVHTTLRNMLFASVTQLVEWSSPKAQVGGSSPSWRAKINYYGNKSKYCNYFKFGG